jgi:hypothetical protein
VEQASLFIVNFRYQDECIVRLHRFDRRAVPPVSCYRHDNLRILQLINIRARLPSLYSDFRQLQAVNPDGFVANVKAWIAGLSHATQAGFSPSKTGGHDRFIISSGDQLLSELRSSRYGQPLALGTVFNEAIKDKAFFPLKSFLNSSDSIYSSGWKISPWQLVLLGWKFLGVGGGSSTEDRLPIGEFAIISNLEVRKNIKFETKSNFSTRKLQRKRSILLAKKINGTGSSQRTNASKASMTKFFLAKQYLRMISKLCYAFCVETRRK